VKVIIDLHSPQETSEKLLEPTPFDDDGLFSKWINVININGKFDKFSINQKPKASTSLHRNQESNGFLKISIIDTGIGITQSQIKTIFCQDNQEEHNTFTNQFFKTAKGLGLYISKNICHKMGGDLKIYSQLGKGTVVTFFVPVVILEDSPINPIQPMTNGNETQRKELNALVVDDEVLSRSVITTFLKKLNVNILEEAVDGEDAFRKYENLCRNNKQPEIITMDINMPKCNGKISSQMIREFEKINNLPPCEIIIISGNCTDSEIRDCLDKQREIQAREFIKKPVCLEEIKKVVDSIKLCESENFSDTLRSV
jgi:CheY-like chemotaxis protein